MLDNFTRQTLSNKSIRTPVVQGKWLNDAGEVFSYLERHEVEKDSWWRSMSTTLTLLKQAHNIIEQSAERINEQTKRIRELELLSHTDVLTGVSNRRGFIQAFTRELDRLDRETSQDKILGGLLIMIDLDNFKSINDTYGHAVGDTALKVVAQTLISDIRAMDVAGRIGGDEFVLLFANTTRKQALERAQFLIKKLNNLSFVWNGKEIPVRASLGLKEYKKGSKPENILGDADADLYVNKRQLKNAPIKQDNRTM